MIIILKFLRKVKLIFLPCVHFLHIKNYMSQECVWGGHKHFRECLGKAWSKKGWEPLERRNLKKTVVTWTCLIF